MTSYTQDGTVGPWAKEKLECLQRYLVEYTKIIRNQDWCHGFFYIDAFAGGGRSQLRTSKTTSTKASLFDVPSHNTDDLEQDVYINGSPKVALTLPHPFTRYFFIDDDADHIAELQALKKEYDGERDITILPGDANNALRQHILNNNSFNWKRHRAVVFLDPFGLQVKWESIAALAETRAIKIILNLPVGTTLQRLLPRSGKFEHDQRKKIDEYFGSPDWYEVVYEESPGLFGMELTKSGDAGKRLALWYRSRLKNAFGRVSVLRLIRNSQGGHLYYLIWAGRNSTGARIAEHVLRMGEAIS